MSSLFDDEELGPRIVEKVLPELKGTPRQIEWAFKIRRDLIAGCRKLVRVNQDGLKRVKGTPVGDKLAHELEFLCEHLDNWENETFAFQWIEHRNNTPYELLTYADANPGGDPMLKAERESKEDQASKRQSWGMRR